MSNRTRNGLFILVPLVLFLPVGAAAQTVAVLGVGGQGNYELQSRVGSMLIEALEYEVALEAVDRRDVNLDEAVMLLGCVELDPTCLGELAATLEVDRVLFATVDGQPPVVHVVYFDSVESRPLVDNVYPAASIAEEQALELHLVAGVAERAVLQVTSSRANTVIHIDGSPSGTAPVVSLELAPGRHVVEGHCDGCLPVPQTVELVRGEFTSIDATPQETVAITDPEIPVEGGDGDGSSVVPIVTMAVGGAIIATGVAFAFMTQSTQDDFDATDSLSEAQDLADTGETQALLTNVFLATGAAVTVTGVILLFTMGGDEEVDTQRSAAVRAAPWFGPSAGGLALDWTF